MSLFTKAHYRLLAEALATTIVARSAPGLYADLLLRLDEAFRKDNPHFSYSKFAKIANPASEGRS